MSAFASYQWVCLPDPQQCLYAELIQIVEARGIAWLRPQILVTLANELPAFGQPVEWVDVRQEPDLLLPVTLLRPALDTEVLSLLPLLAQDQVSPEQTQKGKSAANDFGRRQLNQLIQRLWQADPSSFRR